MPIPDRPVDDAETATDWGQEIHDRVFAPKGTICSGDAVTVADNTEVSLPITDVISDPGGWHDAANGRLEVPPGAEGEYIGIALFRTDDLNEAAELRCYILVNNVNAARGTEGGEGSTEIDVSVPFMLTLVAGDQIRTKAKKIGTAGSSVDVSLEYIKLLRHGAEIGA